MTSRYLLQRRLSGDGARWRTVLAFADDQAPQVQQHAEGLARIAAVEWRVVDADSPMVLVARWVGAEWVTDPYAGALAGVAGATGAAASIKAL